MVRESSAAGLIVALIIFLFYINVARPRLYH